MGAWFAHEPMQMLGYLEATREIGATRMWHPESTRELEPSDTFEIDCEVVDATAPGTCLPGSRLRILDRINDGAYGVVYRGEHVDLGRPLAIKVMREDMMGRCTRDQFLDEARTTGSIESPHVVQVIDFGELADGRPWYAMELLGGDALDQMIERGAVEPARAIPLLRMACKGLRAVHLAGLVHRDVKPQNLVVSDRSGREHLTVVDFGIALTIDTRPPGVCGTPEYMSREQINRGILDARTDVYALGCCAFELLTGTSLIGPCTVSQALLRHDVGVTPSFPEAANVPLPLQEIVRRCLAVDPSQRYADMADLEAALCEAQIACRIPSTRDDLELPAVDPQRRGDIAEGFAKLVAPRRRRRPSSAILSSFASVFVVALLGMWTHEPAAQALGTSVAVATTSAQAASDQPAGIPVAVPITKVAMLPESMTPRSLAVPPSPPAIDRAPSTVVVAKDATPRTSGRGRVDRSRTHAKPIAARSQDRDVPSSDAPEPRRGLWSAARRDPSKGSARVRAPGAGRDGDGW